MMKYFAYGMNTNVDQMANRCPQACSLGRAFLPNHKFRFAGYADVVEHPGVGTDGVLWDITEDCLRELDALEGYPTFYQRKVVPIWQKGEVIEAMVYFMVDPPIDYEPSSHYVKMLLEGYDDHGVPIAQIVNSMHTFKDNA